MSAFTKARRCSCAVALGFILGTTVPAVAQVLTEQSPPRAQASPVSGKTVDEEVQQLGLEGDEALARKDFATARARYQAGLALLVEKDSPLKVGQFRKALGDVALYEDQFDDAERAYLKSVELFLVADNAPGAIMSSIALAEVKNRRGEHAAAAAALRRALFFSRTSGNGALEGLVLGNLGMKASQRNELAEAARLVAMGSVLLEEAQEPRAAAQTAVLLAEIEKKRNRPLAQQQALNRAGNLQPVDIEIQLLRLGLLANAPSLNEFCTLLQTTVAQPLQPVDKLRFLLKSWPLVLLATPTQLANPVNRACKQQVADRLVEVYAQQDAGFAFSPSSAKTDPGLQVKQSTIAQQKLDSILSVLTTPKTSESVTKLRQSLKEQ